MNERLKKSKLVVVLFGGLETCEQTKNGSGYVSLLFRPAFLSLLSGLSSVFITLRLCSLAYVPQEHSLLCLLFSWIGDCSYFRSGLFWCSTDTQRTGRRSRRRWERKKKRVKGRKRRRRGEATSAGRQLDEIYTSQSIHPLLVLLLTFYT